MNEELAALLARLNEPGDNPLSDEELTQLVDGLRARADELRDQPRNDEVVAELQSIATAVGQCRTEQNTRAEAQTQRDADAQAALDAIAEGDADAGDGEGDGDEGDGEGDDASADGDSDADATGDEGAAEDGDAGDGAPAATDAAPVPIAAAGRPAPGQVRAPNPPARRRSGSAAQPLRANASLTAAGNLPGFDAGSEIQSVSALGKAMAKKLRAMGPDGGSAFVASLLTDFPEERMLHEGQDSANEDKYQAAIAPAALTAAGGICGPLAVDYAIPTFATTDRPVRGALVHFGADRGGITFVAPPKISDVAGATGIWTEAVDANPGNATKAIITVACEGSTNVEVDAITTRMRFGNMQGKFSPEQVAANTENAMAAAARVADVNLLNKIHALATEVTLSPSVGAGRGALEVIDQVLAAVRYRMRLSDQARFRAIPPRWFKDMIRTDFAKELPSGTDRLSISDAQIDAYWEARGVTPSWHLDGVAAQGAGITYPLQGFAAQAAGALTAWPTKVVFPIFPEGSFQFLDGGEINLGVVRDSTLDETNDYETFVETFENVAFRGVEALWVIATVAPTGGASGTVTPANP